MTNMYIHFFHKLIDSHLATVGSATFHSQAHWTDTTEIVKYLAVVGGYGYSYNRVSNTSTGKGSGGFVAAPATWGSVLEPTHPYKTKIPRQTKIS